jgi:hypothetical protein
MRHPSLLVPLVSALLGAGCDPAAIAGANAERDPEFPDLDGGYGWTDDDDPAGDLAADGGAPCPDAAPDGGDDEESGDCLDIGWEAYQVDGTCPGLPAVGAIEQAGCALTIPDALGAVIGGTGTIEGAFVHTAACAGVATDGDAPRVELTCSVDSASCAVELAGSYESGFD